VIDLSQEAIAGSEQTFAEKQATELLSEVFYYLTGYLLEGQINPKLNVNLNVFGAEALNFATALKIRFLLDKDVSAYLQRLETMLRRVRTEVSRERDAVKGQVRGRIDWRLTFQQWAQSGLRERDTYIVSKPIKNYNIPENLVLKKTIATLKNLIDDEEVRKEIDRDYSWSQMLKNSRRCLHFILRNVYFLRIKDEKQIRISPRMKSIVRSSRKALYRDSCRIYEQYEKLFRKDPDRTELE
jgi:hypothetical protein